MQEQCIRYLSVAAFQPVETHPGPFLVNVVETGAHTMFFI